MGNRVKRLREVLGYEEDQSGMGKAMEALLGIKNVPYTRISELENAPEITSVIRWKLGAIALLNRRDPWGTLDYLLGKRDDIPGYESQGAQVTLAPRKQAAK